MATQRQIEANRRNAQKSTGPRSASGKSRSSKNSYKHGLSQRTASQEFDCQVDLLARQLAPSSNDPKVQELARVAADADIRLREISQLKLTMMETATADGADPMAAQTEDACRLAAAIPNRLPDLVKLLRYETREAGRKDRAMRKLIRMSNTDISVQPR